MKIIAKTWGRLVAHWRPKGVVRYKIYLEGQRFAPIIWETDLPFEDAVEHLPMRGGYLGELRVEEIISMPLT